MEANESMRQGLEAVREKARANQNRISIGEILTCFSHMELGEEQIHRIYQYLEEQQIMLEDYEIHDTRSVSVGEPALTGEEKAYFQMYLEDLKAVAPCEAGEEAILVQHLLSGDESAQNRLIEGNLHRVLEMARNRAGQGVLIGDLVQEGNMALVTAIEEYQDAGVRITGEPFAAFLERKVGAALEALLQEQRGYSQTGARMAADANRLLTLVKELEEELGRAATLAELAEKMQLPEAYVEEVMRISYHAMENGDRRES